MVAYDTSYSRAVLAKLPVAGTVAATFRVIGRSLVPLYAISLVLTLASLPSVIMLAKIISGLAAPLQTGAGVHGGLIHRPVGLGTYAPLGIVYAIQMVVSLYAFCVISDGTARMLQNGSFGLGPALKTGLVRLLPTLVSAISFYIVLAIGFVFLAVPGILVGAVYGLAPALCVIERRGPFNSFSRSAALTRDNRWRSIGVTLLLLVVPVIVAAAIGGVLGTAMGPMRVYASTIANFFVLPIFYVYPAALACNLRRLKEGGGPAAVAEVF